MTHLDEAAAELGEVLDQGHVAPPASMRRLAPRSCWSLTVGGAVRPRLVGGTVRGAWCSRRPVPRRWASVGRGLTSSGTAGSTAASSGRPPALRRSPSASRAWFSSCWKPGGDLADLAHDLADLAGGLGQLGRAQHDQRHQEDDEHLGPADVEHRAESTGGLLLPGGTAGRRRAADPAGPLTSGAEASTSSLQAGALAAEPPWLASRATAVSQASPSGNSNQSQTIERAVWPRATASEASLSWASVLEPAVVAGAGGGSRGGRRG